MHMVTVPNVVRTRHFLTLVLVHFPISAAVSVLSPFETQLGIVGTFQQPLQLFTKIQQIGVLYHQHTHTVLYLFYTIIH